jgi:peptidoglycan/LPS O-acetylase OafA/YrhL
MDANEPSAPRRRLRIPFAVVAPAILVCAASLQILRGEVIPVGGGLGWDGRFYAETAANLPAALADHTVDAYRARRIVPSALVWLVLQAAGRSPDVAQARDVFAWLNLAFALATLAAWTAAARRSGVGEAGLWLGFVLLFFNFANLKMPYYYAPLTDSCAQALGAALLYCHVARRPAAMILVLAIGAFTWPSLLAFGAFLFVYPAGPASSAPAPAWWRATVTVGTVAAFVALTLVHREAVAAEGGGILAAIVAIAYLASVTGDLTATEGFLPRALLGGGAWRRWALVAALAAAVAVATRAFAAPPQFDTAYFLRHLAIYSQARPGVFLVAHAAYFGLVVAVLLVFWPQVVAVAHRLGTGLTLFLLVHLVWGIHSESRQIVDALPAFALVATLGASSVPWPRGAVALAAGLGLLTSKAWFPINRGGFIGRSDPATYPAQYYFMNQGPWMAAGPFLLQAVVLVAVCGLLWMARYRRNPPPPPDVTPAPPEASRGDIPALTSLRMIAAALVFLHHFPPSASGLVGAISRQGHVGVTVFFVLSGFLITARYFEAWNRGQMRVRDYFTKRVARIFPLYYVVLFLSLWLSGQGFDVLGKRLPEWTMTQGFFWESLYHAAVPTSWSLTVEECFYALAPLVFLLVRRTGGLRRHGAWLAILGAVTAGLWAAGTSLVDFSRQGGLVERAYGFLASSRHMAIYTIFGRFADFAIGIATGFAYLRGDVARLWRRPDAARLGSALLFFAAAIAIVALVLMDAAGGVFGATYAAGWKYNSLVALASALAIVSLTCPNALASRVLAAGPLVYLGKISYALYLVQMSPVGTRALFGAKLSPPVLNTVALYAAMTVVSALLYELVEKPARRLILRAAGLRIPLSWNAPERWRLLLSAGLGAALLLFVITTGAAVHLVRRGAPVAAAEAVRASAGRPDSALAVSLRSAERRGDDLRRVTLPEAWQGTPLVGLFAYVDGRPVPFTVGEPGPGDGASVFTRSLRAGSVLIRCPPETACSDALLVRPDRRLIQSIGIRRLAAAPVILIGIGALAALWIALLLAASRRRPVPHPWLLLSVPAAVAALAAALGLDSWRGGLALAIAGTLWAVAPLVWARIGRPGGLK